MCGGTGVSYRENFRRSYFIEQKITDPPSASLNFWTSRLWHQLVLGGGLVLWSLSALFWPTPFMKHPLTPLYIEIPPLGFLIILQNHWSKVCIYFWIVLSLQWHKWLTTSQLVLGFNSLEYTRGNESLQLTHKEEGGGRYIDRRL